MNVNGRKSIAGVVLAVAALLGTSGVASADPGGGLAPDRHAALKPATAAAAPKPAPAAASKSTNPVAWGVNVLFGGSYGGGGKPLGSDQGTWWYAVACGVHKVAVKGAKC